MPGKEDDLSAIETNEGLPQWLSDDELDCPCWRPQVDPWSGKIPHGTETTEQVNPSTTSTEPVLRSPAAQLLSPHAVTAEARCTPGPVLRNKGSQHAATPGEPCSPQLEDSPHCYQGPAQPKIKELFKHELLGQGQWVRG